MGFPCINYGVLQKPRISHQGFGFRKQETTAGIVKYSLETVRAQRRDQAQLNAMEEALKYLEAPSVRVGEVQDALRIISDSVKFIQDHLPFQN